ncbi:MAG: hypothetical protein DWH78_03605 [Planctomycetota bacterium]|nr:MAG: hypothetical protein DWH78_03605 [Planctomycetota bacterium]
MRANSPGDTTKLLWLRTINHTCETFRNTFFLYASVLCESNATFRFHGQWPKLSRVDPDDATSHHAEWPVTCHKDPQPAQIK